MSNWKDSIYGSYPQHWEITALEDLSEIITDGSHFSPKPQPFGKMMCSVKDMTYNKFDFSQVKYINESDYSKLVAQGCKPLKKDLLISKDGANCLDLLFLNNQEEDFVLLSSIAIVRLKQEVCPEYIRFFLLSSATQYIMRINFISGSAIPRVVLKDFKKVEILLPPLPEQKVIAGVLSSLDDKIDLLHRQNKTLEAIAETLFRQWFVEEAEGDWESQPLGNLVTVKRGGSPRPIHEYLSDTGYRWLKISDATKEISPFIFEIKEHIKESGLNKTTFLKRGSLVLSNSATPGIPKILQVDTCIHDGWLHFPKSYFSNEFLYLLFKLIRPELLMQGNGSIFTNLKTDILKEYKIPIPEINDLKKFQDSISFLFEKLLSNANQIRILQKLWDTLLPKLMNGEVRVEI